MATAPLLNLDVWIPIIDGDDGAAESYLAHYSSSRSRGRRVARGTKLVMGPGYKLLLVTPCRRAYFAWRKQKHRPGVECTFFRNEGAGLSSALIKEADRIAFARWPGERHFTYVNAAETAARRSRHSPPGACFIAAGWWAVTNEDGSPKLTERRGLHILERLP